MTKETPIVKQRIRAAIGAVVACALFGSAALTAVADDGRDLDSRIVDVYAAQNGMDFEKVSHPGNGLRTADGVVDYVGGGAVSESDAGQGDRGQFYSYAAESYGDWVYIGTMYGGLGVQAILKNGLASNMGMSAEAATKLTGPCTRGTCTWASRTATAPAACSSSST